MRAQPETLFFMHIGKTAGSYLNQCFVETFGRPYVLPFCQTVIGPTCETKRPELFAKKAVVSGHVYLPDWTEFCRKEKYEAKLVTVLRSPLHQVASAMRFLDGFNYPERRAERNIMQEEMRRIVSRLADVDFEDAGSIDDFLTDLGPFGTTLFDNQQSRFFLCKARGDLGGYSSRTAPLTLAARAPLTEAVARFAVIGLTERLPETLRLLSALVRRPIAPLASRINESTSPRKIDLENEWIRRALGKRVLVDEWLYRHATELFERKIAELTPVALSMCEARA